jgi:uncharacterized protein (TIGR00255 family)
MKDHPLHPSSFILHPLLEVFVLCSMTGYGEASLQSGPLQIALEVRSVNNRYLKVILRAGEPYHLLEGEFEKVIRKTCKRGTIQVHLHHRRQHAAQDYQLNVTALRSYLGQVQAAARDLGLSPIHEQALFSQALALPGVVPEDGLGIAKVEEDWPLIEPVLEQALARMQQMRQDEGRAMAQELLLHRETIARELTAIRERIPQVAESFRDRLLDRVRSLLGTLDVQIDRADLIKEVSIFAERSDITEEVVRLFSHLDQFREVLGEPESSGRKLEFLTQEMFREANTIGSKASDVVISRHAVEIKATLEKIRELVQNVE